MTKNQIRHTTKKLLSTGEVAKKDYCENCGETTNIHCHHNNYENPFDINFLCIKCHRQVHCQPNGNIKFDRQHRIAVNAHIDVWNLLFEINKKNGYKCFSKEYWNNFANPPKPEKKYKIIIKDDDDKLIHETIVNVQYFNDEIADALGMSPAYFLS